MIFIFKNERGKSMKSTLRTLALIIVMTLVFALLATGCTPTTTTGTQSYKIGLNNLGKGAYPLDVLEEQARYGVTTLGCEFYAVNDEFTVEKVTEDVKTMIAAGCKGVEIFCVIESLFPVINQACLEAKMPFVLYDKVPANEETRAAMLANPYFVGAVGSQNFQAGQAVGQAAVDAKCKKAIIVAAEQGDPTHDARIAGFTDIFEKAGGEVLAVVHCGASEDVAAKADDLITANPEADCVYGSGGTHAMGVINSLKNHPGSNMKVFGTDLDPDLLAYLTTGEMTACNGAHFVNSMFTSILMVNYLDGHPIKDANGKAPIIETLQVPVLKAEWSALYKKFWIDGHPFSEKEIKNLAYRFNSKVTYDDFLKAISNYSIEERLMAKMNEGLVTKQELIDAGVISE
jgi:ribose transport system substrate-binding protein